MVKITRLLLCFLSVFVWSERMQGQLSGTYNVPTNYPTLSAAILALNTQGVSGAVFIEINAGYTEVAPVGGYSLTATGTAINPITFRKTGIGANPLITAYAGGTATPSSVIQDGVWRFIGSDYVTIEGIDITDANTTNPSTMEYGYGFFKANAADGCQNNIIKNCVINLKVVNNAAGVGTAVDGSRGINMVSSLASSQTSVLTPTVFAGTNSNNKFYSNTINNCNVGIALIGYAAPSPFTLADAGNDVGGGTSLQGNLIVNFGGAASAANPAAGIRTLAQYNLNVSNNVINNNNGSGVNHTNVLRGIFVNTALSANVTISNNTLTLNGGGATSQVSAIENVSGASAASNTVSINNNQILNSSNPLNTSGSFIGIYNNGASASVLEINNNRFSTVNTIATTGSNYLIYNTGAVTGAIIVTNNHINNWINTASSSGSYYGIYNAASSSANINLSNNTFSNNVHSGVTGSTFLIYNSASTSGSVALNSNSISNCTYSISSNGSYYGLYNSGTSPLALEMKSNNFSNHKVLTLTGSTYLIYNSAAIAVSIAMNSNSISASSNTITSSGTFYGIYNNAASSNNLDMSSNSFVSHTLTAANGQNYFIYNRGSSTNTFTSISLNNNLILNGINSSTSGPFYSIWNNGVTSTLTSITNNTISGSDWQTSSATRYLIGNWGVALNSVSISNNLVANCTNTTNTTGSLFGIYNYNNLAISGLSLAINNNTFTNNQSTASTGETHFVNSSGVTSNTFSSIQITNNLISNCASTISSSGPFYGIYNNTASADNLNISQNTFTSSILNSFTGATYFIYNRGVGANVFTSVVENSNLMSDVTLANNSSGLFYGILNAGTGTTASSLLSVSSNTFSNLVSHSSTGQIVLINNTCPVATSININNNLILNFTNSLTTSGAFYGIYNSGTSSGGDLGISGNIFSNNLSSSTTGARYYIYNNGAISNSIAIVNNLVSGCTHSVTGSGSFYGMYNNNSGSAISAAISSNTLVNNVTAMNNGSSYLLLHAGSSSNTLTVSGFTNNVITNYTCNATSGNFYGIYNAGFTSLGLGIITNTLTGITLLTTGTGQQMIYNSGRIVNECVIKDNVINNYRNTTNTTGSFYGITNVANFGNSNHPDKLDISSNKITNTELTSSSGSVYFINNTGTATNTITTLLINSNFFAGINHSISANGSWFGVYNTSISGGTVSISSNSITNAIAETSSGSRYIVYNGGLIVNTADISGNIVSAYTSTLNTSGTFYGINNVGTSQGDLHINNNSFININLAATTGAAYGLYNTGNVTNTIQINNNLISSINNSATASGAFSGVYSNNASAGYLDISANTFTNMVLSSLNGSSYLIYCRTAGSISVATIDITNNKMGSCSFETSGGSFGGIFNSGSGISFGNMSISSNTLLNVVATTTTGSRYFIYNTGAGVDLLISNNVIAGFTSTVNTVGSYYGIINSGTLQSGLTIRDNVFLNHDLSATSGSAFVVYNSSAVNNTITFSNNSVTNFTYSPTANGTFYGFYNNTAPTLSLSISGNSLTNVTLNQINGAAFLVYNRGAGNTMNAITFSNNAVAMLTHSATSGQFYGFYNNQTTISYLNISGNSVANFVSNTTNGAKYFIYNNSTSSGDIRLNGNLLSNYTSSINTTAVFYDVLNTGDANGNLEMNGNAFSNQILAATTGSTFGIYNTGLVTGSVNINNNLFSGLSHSCTTGILFPLYNNGVLSANLSMSGNTLTGISSNNTTGIKYLVYNTASATGNLSMNDNKISNYAAPFNTTGPFAGVYNTGDAQNNFDANNNTLNSVVFPVTTTTCYGIYNAGSVSNNSNLNANQILNSSYSAGSSGTFYGVYQLASSSTSLSMSGNTFSSTSISVPSLAVYLVYNSPASTTVSIGSISMNNNSVVNFTNTLGAGDLYGVHNTVPVTNSLSMNSNVFVNNLLESTSNSIYLIYNLAPSSNALSISSNSISNNTQALTTTGNYYGIFNSGSVSNVLKMDANIYGNNNTPATSANLYLVHNSGAATNSISMSGNTLGFGFSNSVANYSGTLYDLYNTGGTGTTTLSINSNSFSAHNFISQPGLGNIYFIYNTNNNSRYDINNNNWNNLSLNHNGNEYLIYNPSSTSLELNVNNNSVSGYTRTGNAASMYLYYSNGNSPSTCSQLFSGNYFSNITTNTQGTGSFYGIYNQDGSGTGFPKKNATNNTLSNINYNGLGFFYGYYFDFLGDDSSFGSAINSNTLSIINWAGPLYGLQIGNNVSSGFAVNVYSNTIQNITTSGATSEAYGAYLQATGGGLNFYKNKLGNISSNGIQALAEGIRVSNASNTSLYNNLIGNIFTPSSNIAHAVNGINITGGARVNVYYNTIKLNASSTGTLFSSNALYSSSNVSLTVRNNIFINTSVPSGTGITAAYRRTTAALSNYSNSSNNNIFYAGVPAAAHLIYADGTNSAQTLPSYQTLVSPRDAASFSENTPFLSTTVTNTNFLHVDFATPSSSESGALNVITVNDDFDAEVRQGNAGYLGSGTAPDIGADEFNQNLIPCSSANAGTVSLPLLSTNCEGEVFYMLSNGYTAAGDIVHQWKVSSAPGGPYTNVSGGIGANTNAYTTASLSAGVYYFILETTCTLTPISNSSNELTVTVHARPSATAAVQSSTLCAGQDLVLQGSSNIGLSYLWNGPNNFTTTVQSPTIMAGTTNASGVYTLVTTDANCSSYPVYVSATIFSTPPNFSLSPAASSLCIGSSQTISASLPITSPTLNFGSQTNQNSASTYPAPYSVYYGGQKMQMLVLANELAAAGFTTGTPIQSIQFPVASLGSNWGNTLNECKGFMIGMKATTSSALSAFETGVSNLVASTNYTPSIGYNNIHNFSAPFIWDGSSNLIIETVFSNSVTGTAGNAVIQYNTPTGFLSTLVYRADNQNISVIAAATTSNVNVGFVRPDFRLNGTQVGNYSWTPSSGLSATSGVSVVASPTATSIYSVNLTDGQCASTNTFAIDVILNPTINISSTSSLVCLGNTATLTASGAASYTWGTNSTNTSIVVAPFVSTTYTVFGTNPACPSSSATIVITSTNALNVNVAAIPPVLCLSGSSTLSASGASTYTWTGGANTNSIIVSPSVTTSYSVTAYKGPGCWTSKLVNVTVNQLPIISISPSEATICAGEPITFEAMGVFSFTWTPGNSNSPIITLNPVVSEGFTVAGSDQNNCVNTATAYITVNECVGVKNSVHEQVGISLFPNPCTGVFNVVADYEGEKEVQIINSVGMHVCKVVFTGKSTSIDLSSFAKGIYFVRIDSNISSTYKLIIN